MFRDTLHSNEFPIPVPIIQIIDVSRNQGPSREHNIWLIDGGPGARPENSEQLGLHYWHSIYKNIFDPSELSIFVIGQRGSLIPFGAKNESFADALRHFKDHIPYLSSHHSAHGTYIK